MNYTYISTATTTVCRSTPGFIDKILVTGGAAGTIIVYDNATAGSGNIIASFDATNAIQPIFIGVNCQYGITVVTSAATKLTVVTTMTQFDA